MEIKYTNSLSVFDYNCLRKSVDWGEIEESQAKNGLKNSAYIVAALDGNKTVGMARMISDGGYIVFIADVIVLPEYQGKAIGKTMMEKILQHIKSTLKEKQKIMVNLMSAKGRETFYTKFGFETRPDEKHGAGLTQWLYFE